MGSVPALLLLLSALPVLSGCSRRAPSPEQCLQFAEMTFGHELNEIAPHRQAKAAFDRLITTCLTAPFDRRVFVCTNESHAPMDCLRRIQPELFGDRQIDFALRPGWDREVL